MEPAHTLSAVESLDTEAPALKDTTRLPSHGRLLVASLVLNTALAAGMTAATMTFHDKLEHLSHRAQADALANERHMQGLAALGDQSRELKSGLVDVRSAAEFASGHLAGAINVPVGDLNAHLDPLGAKDKPIVVYCASGTRSAMARSALKGKGFAQVFNLGAMSRW